MLEGRSYQWQANPKRLLTRLIEGASDLDLQSVEVQLLPSPQIVPNLYNGLQPLRRPLGIVVEALVVLVALY